VESDPLQQLRDVHLPPDPAWWPPAPGWWLLAALLITFIGWSVFKMARAYTRRAPIRAAKTLLADLYQAYQRGDISAHAYLDQGNEILKRLLVRAYHRSRYAHLSGSAWLTALNEITDSTSFTAGPGKILGDTRFSANPQIDADTLRQQFELVIKRVKP